jgi:SAM-dependent methyltransferase
VEWVAGWRRWLVYGARGLVLDLGSDTGRNLPLLPGGTKAVALDLSLDALRHARRRAPAVPLVVGQAEALPFRNATFDTVLSGLVFCSVGDPARGRREDSIPTATARRPSNAPGSARERGTHGKRK